MRRGNSTALSYIRIAAFATLFLIGASSIAFAQQRQLNQPDGIQMPQTPKPQAPKPPKGGGGGCKNCIQVDSSQIDLSPLYPRPWLSPSSPLQHLYIPHIPQPTITTDSDNETDSGFGESSHDSAKEEKCRFTTAEGEKILIADIKLCNMIRIALTER